MVQEKYVKTKLHNLGKKEVELWVVWYRKIEVRKTIKELARVEHWVMWYSKDKLARNCRILAGIPIVGCVVQGKLIGRKYMKPCRF